MKYSDRILHFFQKICRFNFGEFEKEELKKFIRLGLIFGLIVGVYWSLRPLKDGVFIQLVGHLKLPLAKTVSVMTLLPLVMFYTKLLEKFSREKLLILLPSFYGICIFLFSLLLLKIQTSLNATDKSASLFIPLNTAIGYFFYVFVESFGSLLIALFWAFATDITPPQSAKRGFPLIVAIGQIGGIFLPYGIGGLPHRLGLSTDALSLMCFGALILLVIPVVTTFLRNTPKELLISFHTKKKEEIKPKTGFFEGIKLLVTNRYLIGIFGAQFIYEVIVTIFDFNFKVAASSAYSGVALTNYLSVYASTVNIVALGCLLLGISNITRFLGIAVALTIMPIIVAISFAGFLSLNSLTFLFTLMVGLKAINYSLNNPTLKQLYIPTSQDVKFKAQGWIETFGCRLSKQAGASFNMSLAPLQATFGELTGKSYYLMLSSTICFPLLVVWFLIALFLGRSFRKAIQRNTLIC